MHLQICAVLYPGDATENGKLLRLKQQFFLCSASLQVEGLFFVFLFFMMEMSSLMLAWDISHFTLKAH